MMETLEQIKALTESLSVDTEKFYKETKVLVQEHVNQLRS